MYMDRSKHIILASASPRRKELFRQIGLDFEVVVSETDETVSQELGPWETVEELSARKALAVWNQLETKSVVVGADTVVALEGKILGKPGTRERAIEMIKLLRGKEHFVYTGVTILFPAKEPGAYLRRTFHEATKVCVGPISDGEILEYTQSGEPLDKAGAYGIQGLFARFITRIEGDYNNVVGLPVGRLYRELSAFYRLQAEKKAVVFDLDGTLSDSIYSMTYSGNTCLKELGFSPFEEKDYKYFVGDGAANLVKRMLFRSGDETYAYFDRAYARYKEIFARHCMDGVKPYDGIPELLKALKEKGLRLAVLSNKPHTETVHVIETLFGKGVFDIIQGQEEGVPIKPDPQGVFRILERLGAETGEALSPENLIYLGDTGTDVKTGRSAGAFTVGALWGFREREELEVNGADALAGHPLELLSYLE